MTKTLVHIVFKEPGGFPYSGPQFVGVFFDKTSAEVFIAEREKPHRYYIETYEQAEAGMAQEVWA
jgi:hypothetical protein